MKATFALLLALLLALLSTAASAAATPEKQTITFQGKERIYYTFAPEKAVAVPEKQAAPAPLLLLLYDSGGDGMLQIEQWQALAEQEGLVLAAPNSLDTSERSMGVDGPEFLHEIVEAVRGKYSINGKRIYLFGHSAGAVFALGMSVMQPQYFAATGVHAGALRDFHALPDTTAQRKLPVAIWVGTEDPYFSLTQVRNTQSELKKYGLDAQMFEMKGHDHDYYAVAKELNPQIWSFLSANSLDADGKWQAYTFRVAEPKKLRVSSGVADKLKIYDVQPEYPRAARISHITGDVVLHTIIDREGHIEDLEVLSGHPLLIESAMKAVKQWQYRPYILNGKSVEVETTIKIHYEY